MSKVFTFLKTTYFEKNVYDIYIYPFTVYFNIFIECYSNRRDNSKILCKYSKFKMEVRVKLKVTT